MKKVPENSVRSGINKSRRDLLRLGGTASLAAATGFPLVNIARADNAVSEDRLYFKPVRRPP
jgi:hypothetical protein